MLKHRTLATIAAGVMFVYYLFCGIFTALFPEVSFRLYALAFHGIKLTNLNASVESFPEMLLGAVFSAAMTWVLVCSVGWLYNKVVRE